MRYIPFITISLFLMAGSIGQIIYNSEDLGKDFDIYNFTENKFNWEYNFTKQVINTSGVYDISMLQTSRVSNILNKFVDFLGFSSFEFMKFGVEMGFGHPEWDFEYWMNLLIKFIYIYIIILCFPILIPLLAILYLLWRGLVLLYEKVRKSKLRVRQFKKE